MQVKHERRERPPGSQSFAHGRGNGQYAGLRQWRMELKLPGRHRRLQ